MLHHEEFQKSLLLTDVGEKKKSTDKRNKSPPYIYTDLQNIIG